MNNIDDLVLLYQKISDLSPKEWLPTEEGIESKNQAIIFNPIVKNTRGYIEKVSNQINGCYENGWFDACAVMIRRLLETLIIEVFEQHKIEYKIKKDGDYFFLRDLITATLNENTWTIGRNARKALPKLKDIGDKSAHSRRYNACRQDIDELKIEIRDVVRELVVLAKLK